MDLVGAWLRQLLRAGTAAALVPAAIVGALVVVVVGAGGLGGLGSLGQLVSGPQVSPAERDGFGGPGSGRDVAPVSPGVASESVRRAPRTERSAPPRPASPGTAVPPSRERPANRTARVNPGRRATGRPVIPTIPDRDDEARPSGAARPPTSKERAQVLGQKLYETVGDVGTVVQEIVEGLSQTLGRIAPAPPPPPG